MQDGAPGTAPAPLTNDPAYSNGFAGNTGGSWVVPGGSGIFLITGIAGAAHPVRTTAKGTRQKVADAAGTGARYACATHYSSTPGGQQFADGWRLVLDTAP